MGGHYGSVQLRCEDRAKVLSAAEAVARDRGLKCLVGPTLGGWTGVYPEGHGQDETVGQQIAARVGGHALHLLVHDDDVLAYWLWLDGRLLDRYWSAPGYFGEGNRAEEEPLVGDPERFAFVLDETGRAKLRQVLRRDVEPSVEVERLQQLGRVLAVRNVVAAYEYVIDGDVRVTGRRQFVSVPVVTVATAATRRKAVRERRSKLKETGLLLWTDDQKLIELAAVATRDGFVVARTDSPPFVTHAFRHGPPWQDAVPVDFGRSAILTGLCTDAAGGLAAGGAGNAVRLWRVDGGQLHLVREFPGSARVVALSADGKTLAHSTNPDLVIRSLADETRPRQVPANMPMSMQFHPSGDWLIVACRSVGLVAIYESPTWRTLHFDPRMGADEHEPSRVDGVRRSADFEKLWNEIRPDLPSDDTTVVGFSNDGRWAWFGTATGIRIYEFVLIPKAGGTLPPPRWSYVLPPIDDPNRGFVDQQVNAIADDGRSNGVLFGGGTGRLYRMDLATGTVNELLALPTEGVITGLHLSHDLTALAVVSRDLPISVSRGRIGAKFSFEVWSYVRLLGGA